MAVRPFQLAQNPDVEAELEAKMHLLSTDYEAAQRFASEVIVMCPGCHEVTGKSSARFVPLAQLTLRAGLDCAVADYRCSAGHLNRAVPLSDLAQVALTNIFYHQNPEVPQFEDVPTGSYL
jgi:hypothetical protein